MLKAGRNCVLIRLQAEEEGIIALPDQAKRLPHLGVVEAMGECVTPAGVAVDPHFSVGDTVIFPERAARDMPEPDLVALEWFRVFAVLVEDGDSC